MKTLHFFRDHLIEKYGKPLYRVPVNLPLSCPHRLVNSGRGCSFCPEDGARARHLRNNLNLKEQVVKGINYCGRRYGAEPPYIAYFQSFTNTFADVGKLRQYYGEVLSAGNFASVIIATRPDCLPVDVLDYLSELNGEYDLWVELGVQTAVDKTLREVNRGHDFKSVENAVAQLAGRNIKTAAHIILGLPGETSTDFDYTAGKLATLPFKGIKVHNLLVLKNTPLAKNYAQKPFNVMNEYEYAAALKRFLGYLPERTVLMRLQADGLAGSVIAPKWWMKKGQFLDYFIKLFNGEKAGEIETSDGSFTLYHPEYKQHFHSLAGATSEAERKFIEPSGLRRRLREKSEINLLDVGFGLGYNAVRAAEIAFDVRSGRLKIFSLEKDLKPLQSAVGLRFTSKRHREILQNLLHAGEWRGDYAEIKLYTGNAVNTVEKADVEFDVVFLDGFSPDVNPELWTYDFIRTIKNSMSSMGILVTYSSAFPVRGALIRAGFSAGTSMPFGRKRGGTAAALAGELIENPLSAKELNIITRSTAGTAYRDPSLAGDRERIMKRRKMLVKRLRLAGIPKWFK